MPNEVNPQQVRDDLNGATELDAGTHGRSTPVSSVQASYNGVAPAVNSNWMLLARDGDPGRTADDYHSGELEQKTATPEDHSTSKSADDEGVHTTPAWTEMKTKAGKERKRLPLACIACRRKKIRCSGEHPACKHCVRSRIPCVYKVTTRKAAPRTDYMAMLDKRLKRMEERVIKVLPREHVGIVETTGRAALKPSAAAQLRRSSTSKKRVAEQGVADLELWARSHDQRTDHSQLSGIVFPEGPAKLHEAELQSLLNEGLDQLPPKDVQEHLAEVFFDYVYGQSYHLLHKPSFMRKLAHDQIAPVLLLAVCAMAARFSDHPAVRSEPAFLRGETWAAAARRISLRHFDSPNITILIVYLILTLHEFGTCQGGRSWMFGGMAQRMAYALQLHHDLDYDPQSMQDGKKMKFSPTDREIRRRTMWACFLMDRFCSSGTERPTFMQVDHIRARLPIAEAFFTREIDGATEDLAGNISDSSADDGQIVDAQESMGVAAYTIRVIAIWGEAITYHNLGGKQRDKHSPWDERSDFHRLRHLITTWDERLPDRLRYTADNLAAHATEKIANQFIFMHIIYHQTILFLNRFALPSPSVRPKAADQTPPTFLKECAKAAWTAANKISVLVRDGMAHNVVAPFAGYSAFFSGAVHIQGTFSKNEALQTSSKQHLTWNINYLTKMKKYWGMFHFMTENLRELYRKLVDHTRDAPRQNDTADAEDSEYIFQYGDWFDRYPHGVSSAGFASPHGEPQHDPGADAGLGQQRDLHTVEEFFAHISPSISARAIQFKRKQTRRPVSRTDSNEAGEETLSSPSMTLPLSMQNTPLFDKQLPQQQMMPEYQPAVLQEAHELGSMSYVDSQAVVGSMSGYQAELAALAGNAVDPMVGALGMGYATSSMAGMPMAQSTYDGSTSGTWFMPYNLEPAHITQAASAFAPGSVGWSAPFATMQPPEMGLPSPMQIDGPHQRLGQGPHHQM